jgi:hypothetical protein
LFFQSIAGRKTKTKQTFLLKQLVNRLLQSMSRQEHVVGDLFERVFLGWLHCLIVCLCVCLFVCLARPFPSPLSLFFSFPHVPLFSPYLPFPSRSSTSANRATTALVDEREKENCFLVTLRSSVSSSVSSQLALLCFSAAPSHLSLLCFEYAI